jgi:tetratricopeptide (TPR) repeat protein
MGNSPSIENKHRSCFLWRGRVMPRVVISNLINMKRKTFFISGGISTILLLSLFSCSLNKSEKNAEDRRSLVARIDSLNRKMFSAQSMELNRDLAAQGIVACQDFVSKFPDDSLAAEYLFRLSDLSRAVGDNKKAIEYLSRISTKYPAFKKNPECIFLQGYYYQEYFNDTIKAHYFYEQLFAKYPTHAFVADAKALMKMFGKSEEEIIKNFENKNMEFGGGKSIK